MRSLPVDDPVTKTFAPHALKAGLVLWAVDERHSTWFEVGTVNGPACRISCSWAYSTNPDNITASLLLVHARIRP